MDKRLAVELAPGIAFLIGNWIGGIFVGAGLAAVATGLAIVLRWHWDRSLPWFAISLFGLSAALLGFCGCHRLGHADAAKHVGTHIGP